MLDKVRKLLVKTITIKQRVVVYGYWFRTLESMVVSYHYPPRTKDKTRQIGTVYCAHKKTEDLGNKQLILFIFFY